VSPHEPVIHLVDDDPSFRSAAARMLRAAGYEVACHASARAFLAQRTADTPGCLLVDLQMPGMNGIELQRAVASTGAPLPVVFVSAHGDVSSSVTAMKQGAEDFILKTAPRDELLDAVARAIRRDGEERARRVRERSVARLVASLTVREKEVLGLVARGRMNKEIAGELGIHERTVKLHRTALTGKLGVYSVAELTRLAEEAGLLPQGAVVRGVPEA